VLQMALLFQCSCVVWLTAAENNRCILAVAEGCCCSWHPCYGLAGCWLWVLQKVQVVGALHMCRLHAALVDCILHAHHPCAVNEGNRKVRVVLGKACAAWTAGTSCCWGQVVCTNMGLGCFSGSLKLATPQIPTQHASMLCSGHTGCEWYIGHTQLLKGSPFQPDWWSKLPGGLPVCGPPPPEGLSSQALRPGW
jgi:hypothetical protein